MNGRQIMHGDNPDKPSGGPNL